MNYVRLLERVGDIAAAIGTSADEQRAMSESAMRLTMAGQLEDAKFLIAKAEGLYAANERVMAIIREIFAEMARGG